MQSKTRNKRSKARNNRILRTLRMQSKLRKTRTLRTRGGSYEKDATVMELEGVPLKGLNRMVVASDGFVGSGRDFLNHKEYEGTQISTVGGFRSVFKR